MSIPEIPYERFLLDNGLTVIVHEDHKAPVVAVSIWYHVGSANEPVGKTGFAHLFEHLMFSGSEHHRDVFFKPFEMAGATDQNGTTSFDRTNYFQTVPTTALDMTLWMESDRMGHLLGAIGQHELATQLGVVKNEKRQNENQPYGRAWEELQRHIFPANHPYRHTTIGSMEDLDAASLNDVGQWFRTYYGAANVVLVLAGDITPAQAREKTATYFGDIPAGPPVTRPAPWTAPRTESTRSEQRDHVPMVRIMREWNVPGLCQPDLPELVLAARILGGGPTSRLHQRLVLRDQVATSVSVGVQQLALASMFVLSVDIRSGVSPEAVDAAIADEWCMFLRHGPDQDELGAASTALQAGFVFGLEKVGGFAGKASVLAQGQLYRDDPAAYRSDLAQWQLATPGMVADAARRWIAQGDHTLTIVPASLNEVSAGGDSTPAGLPSSAGQPPPRTSPARSYTTTAGIADRSQGVPPVNDFPALRFPAVQRARLSNGINVILAERHAIPVTRVQVLFDAGLAAEQGQNTGIAGMALAMLNQGTRNLDSVEIARRQQRLGAAIQPFGTLDSSGVALSALNSGLVEALELCAQIVCDPAYREEDLERLRMQMLSVIQRQLSDPAALGQRLMPGLLYGSGHPYGVPFSGTGSLRAVQAMTPTDLESFHRAWLRPELATIFVAGDTTMEAILPSLEGAFGRWSIPAAVPKKRLIVPPNPRASRLHFVHRPGAQSQIMAGRVVSSSTAPDYEANELANAIFGGIFTSRLNMNLREDKRWTYGATSQIADAVGPRSLVISTAVQADKTAESIAEIVAELQAYAGNRPPSADELAKAKAQTIRTLPGTYETTDAILHTLVTNKVLGRPDDYAETMMQRIEETDLMQVAISARDTFAPEAFTWVVVGDLSQIEPVRHALGLSEVEVIDAADIG